MIARSVFCMALLLIAACGRKGALVTPEGLAPSVVRDLQLQQRGNAMQLSWPIPKKMAGGGKLTDLASFTIMKHESAGGSDCLECPDAWQPVRQVHLDYLQGVSRLGDVIYFTDRKIVPGLFYLFKVAAVNRDGITGRDSISPRRKAVAPLPPPAVKTVSTPTAVQLEVSYPQLPPGTVTKGFTLYRAREGEAIPIMPLLPAPVTDKSFTDQTAVYGVRYRYAAGVIVDMDGQQLESELSEPVPAALTEPE
jgi:predicted small lipoprotein YifL